MTEEVGSGALKCIEKFSASSVEGYILDIRQRCGEIAQTRVTLISKAEQQSVLESLVFQDLGSFGRLGILSESIRSRHRPSEEVSESASSGSCGDASDIRYQSSYLS